MNRLVLFNTLFFAFLLIAGCSPDKSSTVRPEKYKEDLEHIHESNPELFGNYSPGEVFEGIQYSHPVNGLTYEELIQKVTDTLNWFKQVESYENLNTSFRKYIDEFGGVIKNKDGKYDFTENILINPNVHVASTKGYNTLEVAKCIFSNDGTWILGHTWSQAYWSHEDEILQYEETYKDVLYGDIVLKPIDYYRNIGFIKKVVDIESVSDEEFENWYNMSKFYYDQLMKSQDFKEKREKAKKGWEYFGKQPQLFNK